jgi:hypothetical protein
LNFTRSRRIRAFHCEVQGRKKGQKELEKNKTKENTERSKTERTIKGEVIGEK